MGKASSSQTFTTSSRTVRSRLGGMKPGPIPWKRSLPGSSPEMTALRAGSTATTRTPASCSLRKRPAPEIVPPVPLPYTNASIRPSIDSHSSGPVVS